MEILTREEFEILAALAQGNAAGNLEALERKGLTQGQRVTEAGWQYLEQHKVKRGILLAAGFGSRLMPVTAKLPKPLVKVKGVELIKTLINALLEQEIDEIYIVTGYLSECFDSLKKEYPQIHFLHNERYESENNISSAMLVKEFYGNSYVMDADLYLTNKSLIRKYEYRSNYLGIPVKETDDWCLCREDERITGMVQGGKDTHLMVGVSYWTKEDGEKFSRDIQKLYASEKGKKMFWDDVALTVYNENYNIQVRECSARDIVEIDSVQDLVRIDESYRKYLKTNGEKYDCRK